MSNRRNMVALLGALLFLSTPAAIAQSYPNRPITMVIPTPPGASVDPIGREFARQLSTRLKQPVVVRNMDGAGGYLGAEAVTRAAPDGYTLLFTGDVGLHGAIFFKDRRDLVTELVPIKFVGKQPLALIVSSELKVNNLRDFVALAKANPGKYEYGYIVNTTMQLELARFFKDNGLNLVGVSYTATGTAVQALMGGSIRFVPSSLATMGPAIKGGKAVAIAMTSDKRFSLMPDIPTVKEQGYELVFETRNGLLGHAKIEPAILAALYEESSRVVDSPEMKEALKNLVLEPDPGTPEEWKRRLASDGKRYEGYARALGIERQ